MPEGSYYRKIGQEALAQKKGGARGTPESYREMGHRAITEAEKKKETRDGHAVKSFLGTSASVVGLGIAGAGVGLGQVLGYSLLGWRLDSNGIPRIDKESLADFDRAYRWASGTKRAA